MSIAIHASINRENVFVKESPALTIIAGISDGYQALYALMRKEHPRLNDNGIPRNKPQQRADEGFAPYVLRIKQYALGESAIGNVIDDRNLIGLVINNTHSRYQSVMNTRLLQQIRNMQPHDVFPVSLHLDQIAGTMDNEWRIHGGTMPAQPVPAMSSFWWIRSPACLRPFR